MNLNLNQLAKQICELEGNKKNLTIAQVKEVLKCLGHTLNRMIPEDAMALVQKIIKSGK